MELPHPPPKLDPAAIVSNARELRGIAAALRDVSRNLRRKAGRLAGVTPKPESPPTVEKDAAH